MQRYEFIINFRNFLLLCSLFLRSSFALHPSSLPRHLALPPFYYPVKKVPLPCRRTYSIDELLIITRCLISPSLKVPVFVNLPYYLVVILHNKVLGKFIPSPHHTTCILNALTVEVLPPVRRRHPLYCRQNRILVAKIITLQFALRRSQIPNHHGVTRIHHICHPVINPKCRFK